MLFGDGAGAVVLGPSDSGAGIGPIDLNADGGLGDTILATREDPYIRMDGISTFKIAIKRLSRVHGLRRRAPPGSSSTTSTCSSTTRPTAGSSRPSASGWSWTRRRSPTTSRSSATRRAASIPLTLSLSREDGRLRAGHKVLLGRDRRGLHVGRRRDGVDRVMSRPENAAALVTGASQGHRLGDRQGAGRRRLGRRGQLPLRPGRRRRRRRRRSRRPAARAKAIHADVTNGDGKALLKQVEEELGGPVLALVNNAGVRARQHRAAAHRRGLGHGHRHEPHARLPAHARFAAPDDQGALRAGRSTSPRSSDRGRTPGSPTTPRPRPA